MKLWGHKSFLRRFGGSLLRSFSIAPIIQNPITQIVTKIGDILRYVWGLF
ncbi:MAG: hypothetical protein J6Y94_03275 [Bacteriovoracaceae bacterium]|nr:hypothetical protein [Bacteriovoracaceae bacterium]